LDWCKSFGRQGKELVFYHIVDLDIRYRREGETVPFMSFFSGDRDLARIQRFLRG